MIDTKDDKNEPERKTNKKGTVKTHATEEKAADDAKRVAKTKKMTEERLKNKIKREVKKKKSRITRRIESLSRQEKQVNLTQLKRDGALNNPLQENGLSNSIKRDLSGIESQELKSIKGMDKNAEGMSLGEVHHSLENVYDQAYQRKYSENARYMGIETQAGRDATPMKDNSAKDVDDVIDEMGKQFTENKRSSISEVLKAHSRAPKKDRADERYKIEREMRQLSAEDEQLQKKQAHLKKRGSTLDVIKKDGIVSGVIHHTDKKDTETKREAVSNQMERLRKQKDGR